MVSKYYCLFNLETNQYLDNDLLLVKDYNKATHFDSKEDAIDFLYGCENELLHVGSDWTTREFFRIS